MLCPSKRPERRNTISVVSQRRQSVSVSGDIVWTKCAEVNQIATFGFNFLAMGRGFDFLARGGGGGVQDRVLPCGFRQMYS